MKTFKKIREKILVRKARKGFISVVKREKIDSRYKKATNTALWIEKNISETIGLWLEKKLVSAWFDTYK